LKYIAVAVAAVVVGFASVNIYYNPRGNKDEF
jgi:hypothetical protein